MLEKRKEEKERRKDAEKNPEKKKQLEIMKYMKQSKASESNSLNKMSDKELEAKVKELQKWDKLDMKKITAEQEILFID